MEPLIASLFIVGLYKATEKIWEKGFDAAWEPVGSALKERFTRLAGRDKEGKRQAAFIEAAALAHRLTVEQAHDRETTQGILKALDAERNEDIAEALAEEGAKLMLFSAHPDVSRLTNLCTQTLRWDSFWEKETPPQPERVAAVLSNFLTNLRQALLDKEAYHELMVDKGTLSFLEDIALSSQRTAEATSQSVQLLKQSTRAREKSLGGLMELVEDAKVLNEALRICEDLRKHYSEFSEMVGSCTEIDHSRIPMQTYEVIMTLCKRMPEDPVPALRESWNKTSRYFESLFDCFTHNGVGQIAALELSAEEPKGDTSLINMYLQYQEINAIIESEEVKRSSIVGFLQTVRNLGEEINFFKSDVVLKELQRQLNAIGSHVQGLN